MEPPHFKVPPPLKIFVNLFGLKKPFSNKISRLRWITDRKNNPIPTLTWWNELLF